MTKTVTGRARRGAVSVTAAWLVVLLWAVSACTASTGPVDSGSGSSSSVEVEVEEAEDSTTSAASSTSVRRPPSTVPSTTVPAERSPREVVNAGTVVDVGQFAWIDWGVGMEESEDAVAFMTPSGKITCMLGYGQVTCGIASASFPTIARPADCDENVSWVTDNVRLDSSGPRHGLCIGGLEVPPGANTMDYGMTITFEGYACAVTEAGVTCLDGADRGFFISSSEFRAYR